MLQQKGKNGSKEEIVCDGKEWRIEQVMVSLKKYVKGKMVLMFVYNCYDSSVQSFF